MKVKTVFAIFCTLWLGRLSGKCPVFPLQANFNPSLYTGVWYEALRALNLPFEKYDCTQAKYALLSNGRVSVLNSEYSLQVKVFSEAPGQARFNGANGQVRFSIFQPWGDYRVVSTDYTSYSLIYSCSTFLWFKTEYAWILTRQPQITQARKKELFAILQQKVPTLDFSNFYETKQGGECQYKS